MDFIQTLPKTIVIAIRSFIKQHNLTSDSLIKDSIFSILEGKCTVLYYPQNNEENDGCHVKRIVNGKIENFVYINTHKSIEKQVFTAAHELGHILELDEYLKNNSSDYEEKLTEEYMNRFAAELLCPFELFNTKVNENFQKFTKENIITVDNIIKFSLYLMDYFLIPFKTVIRRFYEIGFFSKETAEEIISDTKILEEINSYIKNLGYKRLGIKTDKKSINDFPELLNKVEKNNIFNKSKLDAIRDKMDIPVINSEEFQNTIKITKPKSE